MKQLLLLLVTLFVLSGLTFCTSKSLSPALVFLELDSLLEVFPDSALSRIRQINPHSLSESERAGWALLMVKAMDKNYIPYSNDSLIRIAVDYYKGRTSKKLERATSYYYLGRVCEELGNDISATDAYLQALNIIGEKGISKLHLYANINLASCYYYQDLYEHSMERYQTAYHIATRLGDKSSLFFPLRAIGGIHASLNQTDSALFYYQKSLGVAQENGDSLYSATVLSDIAQYYNILEMYGRANEYISKAIAINPSPIYYYVKGDILSKCNQLDSARYYLEKSLDIDNLYTYVSSNYALYNLEKNRGHYANAVKYADEYIIYYDSIQHQRQRAEVTKLMDDHALESHKKEIGARQQRFMLYLIIGILLMLTIYGCLFFLVDRKKKQKLIGLQQELMRNRSRLIRLHNKLATSTTEIEIERQEKELTQQKLRNRQKDLCMRLFESTSSYKIIQEFLSAKRQKKHPKELTDRERLKMQQSITDIYADFIQHQHQSFPQLSQADLYCCVLAYMGFSNSLIGYVMGADPNVITQRRYRIKGKIDEMAFNLIFSSSASLK